MLSLESVLNVPGFSTKEIGKLTLVREKLANFEVKITNDSQSSMSKLNVKMSLESYVGQIKPILFRHWDPQIIDNIPSKGMVPLSFSLYPSFPGLISTSITVTDSMNNIVKIKRDTDTIYNQSPVRWWFHVADDISIEILRTLKRLVKQEPRSTTK